MYFNRAWVEESFVFSLSAACNATILYVVETSADFKNDSGNKEEWSVFVVVKVDAA